MRNTSTLRVQLRLEKGLIMKNSKVPSNVLSTALFDGTNPVERLQRRTLERDSLSARAQDELNHMVQRGLRNNPEQASNAEDIEQIIRSISLSDGPRIEDAYRISGKDFPNSDGSNTSIALTVGDLQSKNRVLAASLLSLAAGETVTDDGDRFVWRSINSYGPQLIFAADPETQLRYDENGMVQNPAMLYPYPFSADTLQTDFDARSIMFMRGELKHNEKGEPVFCIRPIQNASDSILLAVKWDDVNQPTRGTLPAVTTEKTVLKITLYAKGISNKGNEGYDFFIVPCNQPGGNLNRLIAAAAAGYAATIAEQEAAFVQKFQLLAKLDAVIKERDLALASMANTVRTLELDCNEFARQHSLKASTFHRTAFAYIEGCIAEIPESPRCLSPEELQNLVTTDLLEKARFGISKQRAFIYRWKEFAPRYKALEDTVESLGGELFVADHYASINLPGESQKTYAYSESDLESCLNYLDECQKLNRSTREKNNKRLAAYGYKG